jgi:hypothetical protein
MNYHSKTTKQPRKPKKMRRQGPLEPAIKDPTNEELEEVCKNLSLNPRGAAVLTNFVCELAQEVKAARARGDPDLVKLRRRRPEFLQRFSQQLAASAALLNDDDAKILRGILGHHLGKLLSTRAFERIVGRELGHELSPRDLEMAQRNHPHSDLYRTLEFEVELERQDLGLRFGDRVLANVIRKLIAEIQKVIDVERTIDKGGAPGKPIRRFILWRLMDLHNMFCHLHGEAWTKDRYLELAEQVLPILGQEKTNGLEKAVERLIGKL